MFNPQNINFGIDRSKEKFPCFSEAKKFLEVLVGNSEQNFTFQTFDDSKEKRSHLSRIINGSLEDVFDELSHLNQSGAGIFVTVNKTDGKGRRKENIISLNSLFADKDDGNFTGLNLTPSMIIQSKRGQHAYWLLQPGERLDRFESSQKALSTHLVSDPKVYDLSRVMRVPGFYHLKNPVDPFLVRIIDVNGRRFTIDEILSAYPVNYRRDSSADFLTLKPNLKAFRTWVETLSTQEGQNNPLGGRNNTLVVLIRNGLGHGLSEAELEEFVLQYCKVSGEDPKVGIEMLARHVREHNARPFSPGIPLATHSTDKTAFDFAKQFLHEQGLTSNDGLKLRFWRGDFYEYLGTRYEFISETDIKAKVTAYLQSNPNTHRKSGTRLINEIITNLIGLTHIPSNIEIPSYLGNEKLSPDKLIPMQNGILNLEELLNGEVDPLMKHTPEFFSPICFPYAYQRNAKCPRWIQFLDEMIPQNEVQRLIQEWFGYNLIFDTSQQKCLFFIGEGANGKSVICGVLRLVLGIHNVSAVGLEAFNPTRTFPMAATFGKLANIVEEIGDIDKAAEGLFKQFVNGGLMTVERKHRDPFEFRPTARLTYATNILPRFSDRTDALWRRLLLVSMKNQILDESKQDKNLANPDWWLISGELPGVFNWAVEGLRRLKCNGQFTIPEECRKTKELYKFESNPAKSFLFDHCSSSSDPNAVISSRKLYKAYVLFTEDSGCKPLGEQQFAREVKRVFSQVQLTEHPQRQPGGEGRSRNWQGLVWKALPDLPDQGFTHQI